MAYSFQTLTAKVCGSRPRTNPIVLGPLSGAKSVAADSANTLRLGNGMQLPSLANRMRKPWSFCWVPEALTA